MTNPPAQIPSAKADPTANIPDLLAHAQQRHAAGELDAAAHLYSQVIAIDPQESLALNRLGIIHYQSGRLTEASHWLGLAVKAAPQDWEALYALALVSRASGQIAAALEHFRQASEAFPAFEQAHRELAATLAASARIPEAVAYLRGALQWLPQSVALQSDLAAYLAQSGHHVEGESFARAALSLNPNMPNAWVALGGCLMAQSRYREAADAFRRALALNPNATDALISLGGVLTNLQQWDESLAACRAGVERSPNTAVAHYNLGRVLELTQQYDEAIRCYDRACELRPGYGNAEWGRAAVLLATGQFARGWVEYEARWRRPESVGTVRQFPQPRWNGEGVAGRTLLLHAEQGYGDTIQFARYVPLLAARGARIVFECQAQLQRVMRTLDGVTQLLAFGQPIPAFDLHCPLLSVAQFLSPSESTIPAHVPYLAAESDLVERWKRRLDDAAAGAKKVGLVWAGSPDHPGDARRSMTLAQFAPLAQVRGVRWFSLQKGPPTAQLHQMESGLNPVDLDPELNDFADTAAALAGLDLVITVDTAVAHLAGALARPVWTLLSHAGEWRWLIGREDTPWYPTMKLFRQPGRGDWAGVVERLAVELAQLSC